MSASSLQGAPPQIRSAIEQLKAAIRSVDGRAIDEHSTPWREIEKSIIKLLGGAFNFQRADHQAVALGLAGIYAARLISQHQAFWFPTARHWKVRLSDFRKLFSSSLPWARWPRR